MKTKSLFLLALAVGIVPVQVWAQKVIQAPSSPVVAMPANPGTSQGYVYEQKPLAGRAPLVTPEQAQSIIDKFKEAYGKLGHPRLVIYVNRELVDENSGFKLTAHNEQVDRTLQRSEGQGSTNAGSAPVGKTSSETEKVSGENRYRLNERKESPLADRQTVRDIERLFGRPLRMAGVTLADQRVATQLISGKPLQALGTEGEQASKDREALSKIADVAVEILVGSKNVPVAELTGDRTYALPDIQVTAIKLSDAKILGQASSSDVMRGNPAYYARNFDVREITEAVALALMEDMLTSVPASTSPASNSSK